MSSTESAVKTLFESWLAGRVADPFTILIATGLRRGALLGLRWCDYDEAAGTLAVCGTVVRVDRQGTRARDDTKTTAGRRTVALPRFAIDMLAARRTLPYFGEHPTIRFPSTAGTWRDTQLIDSLNSTPSCAACIQSAMSTTG